MLSSCGAAKKDIGLAKESVDQFHSQLDSEQYSAIYGVTNDGFRSATSEADFTKLLQAVHRKLGKVQDANLKGENIAWYAGQGTTVRLVYATNFASGSGTEEFVWRINSTRPYPLSVSHQFERSSHQVTWFLPNAPSSLPGK